MLSKSILNYINQTLQFANIVRIKSRKPLHCSNSILQYAMLQYAKLKASIYQMKRLINGFINASRNDSA